MITNVESFCYRIICLSVWLHLFLFSPLGLLSHPCNRSMTLELIDSVVRFECGITFTRTWRVVDDCGNPTSLQQTVRVLDDIDPVSPPNGQLNSDLYETLEWPQYPGAILYRYSIFCYARFFAGYFQSYICMCLSICLVD